MAYTAPTPDDLKQRYPAFASVSDVTIQYWLTDSLRSVGETWIEGDRAVAEMALAAHNMSRKGVAGIVGSIAQIPVGVSSFKSGSMDVSFNADAVKAQVAGGYASTEYGLEFEELQRRSFAGPRVTGGCGYAGYPVGYGYPLV